MILSYPTHSFLSIKPGLCRAFDPETPLSPHPPGMEAAFPEKPGTALLSHVCADPAVR
ncbi:hypothetical protein HMPREF3038_02768 [Akkermansia sp. KLE1797]|nr:hypothetical protein HMPREF3038_02768 [Akkermansia sp. KLE1797]KXU53130.1 hypothetical protein HMPREF3039_02686 [Akkermansia sp. KLE1798]KZA03770.1 hypothetical protein HMPREF1326_02543 [Akkermansia sp. KLE1605]